MAKVIKRGDIWTINLEPSIHRELHKIRPALIISNDLIHKQTFHVIVIPISSQVPSNIGPEMVLVGKKEGLDKESVILPLFIRSIDQKRLVKKIGKLAKTKLLEVEESLKLLIK